MAVEPGTRLLESCLGATGAFLWFAMLPNDIQEFTILGTTRDGKTFRPGDWSERLAGVMSLFRPGGAQRGSHLGYSPWCVPSLYEGGKCVIVRSGLRDHDVLAWDFCVNFALDNDLRVLVDGKPYP